MTVNFHLVTAVWGERYVGRFLSTTLPSMLAPGNIPALVENHKASYYIYTTAEDMPMIRRSSLFELAERLLPIRLIDTGNIIGKQKYERATNIHVQALKDSHADDRAAAIFLPPDGIWSDRTLARIAELADAGYRAVMADGLRVVRDTFMPAFQLAFGPDGGALIVPPRDLIRLALEHIHPYEAAITWGSEMMHDVPFRLHWNVPGEGILSRGFCILPLMLLPQSQNFEFFGAIDHGLVDAVIDDIDKIYYCRDTDEIANVSIDEQGFSSANFKHTDKRDRIVNTANWAYRAANRENLGAVLVPHRRHYAPMAERRWRRAEIVSRHHIDAVLACRKLYLAVSEMKARGLKTTPAVLSYALKETSLPRRMGNEARRTILAPNEESFGNISKDNLQNIMKDETALLKRLSDHVIPGAHSAEEVLRDNPNLTITAGDIQVDDWLLHIIEQPLGS